jgi:hypothetical protein
MICVACAIVEEIQEGGMPPIQYWIFHPQAHLNEQQKQALIDALQSSIPDNEPKKPEEPD